MANKKKDLLQSKAVNSWTLFWLLTLPISLAMIIALARLDMTRGENVSSMIQLSVRCSIPFLYLAFAASSFHALFPSAISRWLLRNRKIMGLCFASAMAWQLLFILWLVGVHTQYYVDDVYLLSDAIEGVLGYIVLFAMVLTSFKFGRSRLSARQWKLLHKGGIYYLWAYAWSVYWYELFYYDYLEPVDYVYYWAGILAWGLRMGSWTKKHRKQEDSKTVAPGTVLIVIGVLGIIFGSAWSPQVFEIFAGNKILEAVGTYVPYFPFEPFFPIFIIMLGSFLTVRSRG